MAGSDGLKSIVAQVVRVRFVDIDNQELLTGHGQLLLTQQLEPGEAARA